MLHVCQQLALLHQQYNTSSAVFFIISYFGFGFPSAYNLILFCCLRRNVEPCCHTQDSRSTVIVYSARACLVSLALWVIMRGAWWSNTHIKQNASRTAAGAIYNHHRAAVIDRKARYSLRIEILAYPTCIRHPRQGGYRRNSTMPFGTEKLEWCGYLVVKNF